MSVVKSYAVGSGDMFYIRHNTDNFTIIDCDLCAENADEFKTSNGQVQEKAFPVSFARILTRITSEASIFWMLRCQS